MRHLINNARLTNFTINSMAIILGILWWSVLSELHRSQRTITIPLCFYNAGQSHICAPENITITISGKRSHLRALNASNVAAHIDAQSLPEKTSMLNLKQEHLLLPQLVNLVSYSPSNPLVTLQKNP